MLFSYIIHIQIIMLILQILITLRKIERISFQIY